MGQEEAWCQKINIVCVLTGSILEKNGHELKWVVLDLSQSCIENNNVSLDQNY